MSQYLISGRHVGIPVQNLKIMSYFYQNTVGFKILTDEIEEGSFISNILGIENVKIHIIKMVSPDGWMLELLEYLNPENLNKVSLCTKKVSDVGFAHIALTVKNIEEFVCHLKANSVTFISEPLISKSGKAKVCFCQDPEHNFIELVELL